MLTRTRNVVATRTRKMVATTLSAFALAGVTAGPAFSQPVVTGGLVNVTITNVLNNNEVAVQIPINAAANICGVDVDVLAADIAKNGSTTCTARSGNQSLEISQ